MSDRLDSSLWFWYYFRILSLRMDCGTVEIHSLSRSYQQGPRRTHRFRRFMIISLDVDLSTWCAVMDAQVFGDPKVSRQLPPRLYLSTAECVCAARRRCSTEERSVASSHPVTVVVELVGQLTHRLAKVVSTSNAAEVCRVLA